MSRIDDVITELTPKGVQFKLLGEIAEIRSGWGFPNAEQGIAEGDYPFYKVSDMNLVENMTVMKVANNYVSAEVARRLGANPAPAGTIIFPKIGAAVATNKKRLLSTPSVYDNNVMGLIPGPEISSRFLYYWMQTFDLTRLANHSGAVPSIRKSEAERVLVPVPHIDVQNEIVRVLDLLSTATTDLATELGAELGARRRQYTYYRDALFEQSDFERAPMGKLGEFIRGRRFTKNDVVDSGIPAIHYGEIYTHYGAATRSTITHVRKELAGQLRFAQPGDVVIAAVGETVEDVAKAVAWLGDGPVAIHDDTFLFRSDLHSKYVSYFMQTAGYHGQKNKHVARAKVKRLSGENLAKIVIPVPPLMEQERIVAILDRLEAIVNDLRVSLSAEINARRKQYEYYRDRLLTFEESTT
ncbi:restriction endonuclease subunit S [Micromonospora chalcea]|uniref:restriction endonuclease subunit S n=1 Tax=Micromonospora chalcea TaxID=1874 RepID=UPI003F4A84EC